jgi:colanic acid/amylovoran biosynthesis glycosyltransferase
MQRRPLVHILCDEARERALSLGADPARIVDANLPLPIEDYPNLGPTGPVTRWLIPARFVEKKGHDVALRAFRLHLADYPQDRLTCWGYGDARWLEKRIAEHGLGAEVEVIDNHGTGDFDRAYVEQLERHDAVLAPSVRSSRGDDEGGPALTAVLAQVAAKPVILSDFPGSERSVTDGVEGLIVPQGNAQALSDAMHHLASDPEAARQMGAAGRARATKEFSRDSFRAALLGWYESLC